MLGMNAHTGRMLDGVDHLRQSIGRILTTPLRSRIARRLFGAELLDLVDAPLNPAACVRLYAACATALMKYEPRLRLRSVSLVSDPSRPGTVLIDVQGTSTLSQDVVSVRINLPAGGARP